MKNNNSLIVRKDNIFFKIVNKIKKLFFKEKSIRNEEIKTDCSKKQFIDNIKLSIDTEISILKIKLETGEIKAIELTNEQIDKLQKIYDEEIEKKKNFLKKINVRENIEFKYNELLNKFKILGREILEKNNIIFENDIFLRQMWDRIKIIYPEKRTLIDLSIQMIYNDEILTEYNFNKLEEIYNKLKIIIL